MFRAALILYCCLIATITSGQAQGWQWGVMCNDDGASRICQTVVDNQGNTYAVGNFSENAILGQTALPTVGGQDFFIAKYDQSNSLVWVRQGGSTGEDE